MSDTGKGKIDIVQLVKILSLTQSESDGEALNAMRMANSKLKAAGLTWQDILSQIPKSETPKKPYRWKEAPSSYDGGFFREAMKCKEFDEVLSKDQKIWLNALIGHYNKHRYLPQDVWTQFARLWYNFREHDRG